jgi:predicted P-loop ATPase
MTVPRRAVALGSKNPPYEYLDDGENRRFWPVRTGVIDIPAIERDREQLLAEALMIARRREARTWTIGKDDSIWAGSPKIAPSA